MWGTIQLDGALHARFRGWKDSSLCREPELSFSLPTIALPISGVRFVANGGIYAPRGNV